MSSSLLVTFIFSCLLNDVLGPIRGPQFQGQSYGF
ncbi:hypothetical protein GLYMA_03G000233v4 [Glycine max]|nr:hypothetical protein GLYMA_03G000233v4 [Glycine max]KAH1067938.1 hypothetical protein GYH30_005791 [Glycine max]